MMALAFVVSCAPINISPTPYEAAKLSSDKYTQKADTFVVILDGSRSMDRYRDLRRLNVDDESLFDRSKNCIKSMIYTLPNIEYTGALRTYGAAIPSEPVASGIGYPGAIADMANRRSDDKAPLLYWLTESSREGLIATLDLLDEPNGAAYTALAIDRTTDDLLLACQKPTMDKSTIKNIGVDATNKAYKPNRGKMAVILVSDGVNISPNTGSAAVAAVKEMKRRFKDAVVVHTICVGGDPQGVAAMETLANIGGGVAAQAENLTSSSGMINFVTQTLVTADNDGDGVANAMDKCPATPANALANADGCTPDTDKDGVYNYLDRCPNTPKGLKVTDEGCPYDTDADGKYDDYDRCPLTPEWLNDVKWGCPPIKRYITFDYRQYEIRPWMHKILDEYAQVLKQNNDLIVEVSGHTSRPGSAEINEDLSKNRAASVAAYLTNEGVNPSRIRTKWYGPANPVASNDTAQGRAKNRRAELNLVKE
jgi:outer membrane protein OmpA-like peptidoglycan-associated protein